MEEQQQKTMKTVYTVVDRGPGNKSFWVRIGVGFTNRDGSLTIRLDALPVSGSLQVREWEAPDRRHPEGFEGARGRPGPRDLPPADPLG
jgi:hypothetical protein